MKKIEEDIEVMKLRRKALEASLSKSLEAAADMTAKVRGLNITITALEEMVRATTMTPQRGEGSPHTLSLKIETDMDAVKAKITEAIENETKAAEIGGSFAYYKIEPAAPGGVASFVGVDPAGTKPTVELVERAQNAADNAERSAKAAQNAKIKVLAAEYEAAQRAYDDTERVYNNGLNSLDFDVFDEASKTLTEAFRDRDLKWIAVQKARAGK